MATARALLHLWSDLFSAARGGLSRVYPLRFRAEPTGEILPAVLPAHGYGGIDAQRSEYQLIYVLNGARDTRLALDSDVQTGQSPQVVGKALPFQLSAQALKKGDRFLWRESLRSYQNKALHDFLARWVYSGASLFSLFETPLLCGVFALFLQLPFSIRKDVRRRQQLRYGRRLKGPLLVSGSEFSKALDGDGIGLAMDGEKKPLRIPRAAENKHILTVGDTGAGKSTIIRQILFQVAERGHSAIVYDPACEFIQQFYDERRGDIVLNPLDARCPYWSPSDELQRKAEAKAIAVSLSNQQGLPTVFLSRARKRSSHIC